MKGRLIVGGTRRDVHQVNLVGRQTNNVGL